MDKARDDATILKNGFSSNIKQILQFVKDDITLSRDFIIDISENMKVDNDIMQCINESWKPYDDIEKLNADIANLESHINTVDNMISPVNTTRGADNDLVDFMHSMQENKNNLALIAGFKKKQGKDNKMLGGEFPFAIQGVGVGQKIPKSSSPKKPYYQSYQQFSRRQYPSQASTPSPENIQIPINTNINEYIPGGYYVTFVKNIYDREGEIIDGLLINFTSELAKEMRNIIQNDSQNGSGKLSDFINTTGSIIKEKAISIGKYIKTASHTEIIYYESLTLLGRLTYIESTFLRLLKFCLCKTFGPLIGALVPNILSHKFFYYLSIFAPYVGVSMPGFLTSMSSLDSIVKLALMAGGCHAMGIILGINVFILILYLVKKAIDFKKGKTCKEILNLFSPSNMLEQIKKLKLDDVGDIINIIPGEISSLEDNIIDKISIIKEKTVDSLIIDDDVSPILATTINIIDNIGDTDIKISNIIEGSSDFEDAENIKNLVKVFTLLPSKITDGLSIRMIQNVFCSLLAQSTLSSNAFSLLDQEITKIKKFIKRPTVGGSNSITFFNKYKKTQLIKFYQYKFKENPSIKWSKIDIIHNLLNKNKPKK